MAVIFPPWAPSAPGGTVTIGDIPGLQTILDGKVDGNGDVTDIVKVTEAEFDAITDPDDTTQYLIV